MNAATERSSAASFQILPPKQAEVFRTPEECHIMMEHFYVKFGNPSCRGFRDIVSKTDGQTHADFAVFASKIQILSKTVCYSFFV